MGGRKQNHVLLPVFTFISLIAGFILYYVEMKKPFYSRNLGSLEIICLVFSFLLIMYSANAHIKNQGTAVLTALLVLPVVYMSLQKLTFYLSIDELKSINEQINITDREAFSRDTCHWVSGDSRTNYLILGTLVKIIPEGLINALDVTQIQMTKALHYLIGIVTIDIIVFLTYKKSFSKNVMKTFEIRHLIPVILFYAIMSLQVTQLSLKTVNYDMNSLLFALLSVMYIIYAIREDSVKNGIYAVIAGFLATQDKMLAGPLLYLALLTLAILVAKRLVENNKKTPLFVPALAVTVIPVIFSYIVNIYVGVFLVNGYLPSRRFCDVVYSYVQYSLTILEGISPVFKLSNMSVLINLIILWIIFTIASYITKMCITKNISFKMPEINARKIATVSVAAILVLFAVSVLYIYMNPHIYMSPLYPVSEGNYSSGSEMNGITYHFDAKTMAGHFLKLTGTIFYIFYKSIPSGVIISLIILLVLVLKWKKRPDMTMISLTVLSAVIFPLMYSAIQITPNERYQNVYILTASYLIIVMCLECCYISIRKATGIWLFISVLNAWDVSRFGYTYTEYFALWDTAYISEDKTCETGIMVPGYHGGWGDHVIIAGEKIAEYANENKIPYETLNIYCEYNGNMLSNEAMNIVINESSEWSETGLSENDFYVVSRGKSTKNQAGSLSLKLIQEAEPFYTFGYNGATEMWIFTGDEVKKYIE